MTRLTALLDKYRSSSKTEREKGTYFEQLIQCYLQNEPGYAELYGEVLSYADWAETEGLSARDTGIDLLHSCAVNIDAPSVGADLRVCSDKKGAQADAPLHGTSMPEQQIFRVEKMRYGKTKIDGKTRISPPGLIVLDSASPCKQSYRLTFLKIKL